MKMRWHIGSVSAVVASVVYLIFTFLAYLKYPGGFSPVSNWLSDLGNPQVNQSGAVFYNLGCILAAVGLVIFFLSLEAWATSGGRTRWFVTIALISGAVSSISLIISALFPLGPHTPVHSLAAKFHVIFLGFFLTFSAAVLLKRHASPVWPAYLGLLAAVVNFIYGAFLHSVFVAEWVALGMFVIYVLALATAFRRLPDAWLAPDAAG